MKAYVPFVSRTCETDPSSLCSPSPARVIYFSRLLAKQAPAKKTPRRSFRDARRPRQGLHVPRARRRMPRAWYRAFRMAPNPLKYCNCILSCAMSRVRSAATVTLRNMFGERPYRLLSVRARNSPRNRGPLNKNSLGREGRFCYLSRTRYMCHGRSPGLLKIWHMWRFTLYKQCHCFGRG